MAPELCLNEPHNFKVDVWAAGVILYKMMTQKYPFDANNSVALAVMIAQKPVENIEGASATMNELIQLLLSKNPESRPTIDQIL
jgi:serine/threonine protein kinase